MTQSSVFVVTRAGFSSSSLSSSCLLHRAMLTSRISTIRDLMFIVLIFFSSVINAYAAGIPRIEGYEALSDPFKSAANGRRIFDFRKNGIKLDVRVVPAPKNESSKLDDGFPDFPTRDIGLCIINFSLVCAKKRFGRFLESIKQLNEIFLLGREIKLVKTRVNADRKILNESQDSIERSVTDFFDTFALRVTLPRWNGKRERNQIDLMFDETALSEGRGKGGGGKGKGGKCMMMMMAGVMMFKMKIMGIAAMKSMMMSGMSLMMSMAMLMGKWMKGGGGPWQSGGGPWQSGGGGQLKEIVLLTKSSGGGGGGGCCPSPPPDSYGAPPSGGGSGAYGGGGGGWGRSFGRRFIMAGYDNANRTNHIDSTNLTPMIGESVSNTDEIYDQNRGSKNLTSLNWNSNKYVLRGHENVNGTNNSVEKNSDIQPLMRSADYTANPVNIISRSSVFNRDATGPLNYVASEDRRDDGSSNYIANTNRPDVSYDTNVVRPTYADEWKPTEEKTNPIDILSYKNYSSRINSDSSLSGL